VTLVIYSLVAAGFNVGFFRLLVFLKYFTLREIAKEIS